MKTNHLKIYMVIAMMGLLNGLSHSESLPTINPDLSIHLPNAVYVDANGNSVYLSANLSFKEVDNNGDLLWRLANYEIDTGGMPEKIECTTLFAAGEKRTLHNRREGLDYIINCKASVLGDLIIEPGVSIQFDTDSGIVVGRSGSNQGSIQAIGTAEQPIVFTGEDKVAGAWSGILINSNDIKNSLQYCQFEYAGGSAFNSNGDLGSVIVWSDSHLNMANTHISHSASWGLNANYGGSTLMLTNNTMTANKKPMLLLDSYITMVSGGSYNGNEIDAIFVEGHAIKGLNNWTNLEVPYRITSDVIFSEGILTIQPGVTLEFENGTRLNVGNSDIDSLIAVGTEEDPITFTAVNKQMGAWQGIYFGFTNSPQNEIGFATIAYASNSDQAGAIYMWSAPTLNVHDVMFENIQRCAFYAAPDLDTTNPNPNLTISNLSSSNISNIGGGLCGGSE